MPAPALLRLAILSNLIVRTGSDPELSMPALHESCARVASFVSGLAVVPRSEILQSELDEELRNCGADAKCIASRLDRAGIALGALLVVNTALDPTLITMRLIDTARGSVLAERATAVPESTALLRVVASEFSELLGAGNYPSAGKIVVDVWPAEAKVSIDPDAAPAQTAPHIFVVAPGEYRVSAAADGYVETSSTVQVRRRMEEAHLAWTLEAQPAIYESPWFWTGVAAVLAAGVAGSLALFGGEERVHLCQSMPGGPSCPNGQ